ncbi:hypothetical protein BDB00DRAFT_830059 [Zychaea mexicana]|uniref:uncharacterized protein n=1 Tax=Zychaea mexicana TaxID=64656 RepID=UPI0022FEB358|nr:uncharacterized protein BDB00DRAFT_830059 [Zychaea mexicana]KAI9492068.1 hypothetical protein BDB00DRAFT_830059 [Zychaea mexicana]
MDEHGFEARLRHLEHIVAGQTNIPRSTKTSILKRIDDLKKELHTLYKSNKPIKEFIERYDAHAKLLDPADSTLAMERELLTTDTKLELVLAACDDLEKFAGQVRQVKSLEHVVSGSEYDALDTLGPQLAPLEAKHAEQAKELAEVTKKISVSMDNYNGIVNTLSEIFISWDDILSTMETHVTALERQRAQ